MIHDDVPCGTIREARLEALLVRALEAALPGGLEDPESCAAEGQWAEELFSEARRELPLNVIRAVLSGGSPRPASKDVLVGRAACPETLMTAIGPGATVDRPGDFAVTISADGDCLTIDQRGGSSWVGGISLRQAADAAASTIVKSLWGEPCVTDAARAMVLVRLYDRMDHDAREASLKGAQDADEALAHFRGRLPTLVVDPSDEDIARSIALLRVFNGMNSLGRWSALNTLILVGLDVSRKFKRAR